MSAGKIIGYVVGGSVLATAIGALHLTRGTNPGAVTTPMPAQHAEKARQDEIKGLAVQAEEDWRDELEGFSPSQASARKLARRLADEVDFLSASTLARKLELDQLPCSGPMVLDVSGKWIIPIAAIADVNFDFFNDNAAALKYFEP